MDLVEDFNTNTNSERAGAIDINIDIDGAVYNGQNEAKPEGRPPNHINCLTGKGFNHILRHLSFADLLHARLVCSHWNECVTSFKPFVSRTVLNVISLAEKPNAGAPHWTNVRLSHLFELECESRAESESDVPLDIGVGASTPIPTPPLPDFLRNLESLEFSQCDLPWVSIKKYIVHAGAGGGLRELILTNCTIAYTLSTGADDAEAYEPAFTRIMHGLPKLVLRSTGDITAITSQIYKFVDLSFTACCLQELKVEYFPASGPDDTSSSPKILPQDANYFSLVLAELIKLNATTLKSLILNLRCSELLNAFCPVVLTNLEPFYEGMRLRTFKLTEPLPTTPDGRSPRQNLNPVVISTNLSSSFFIFFEFLRSQARLLKSLAFPHFANLGSQELRRTQLLDCLNPRFLEELRLPGHVYLKKNFLKVFTRLRFLYIGEKCGPGYSSTLNPTKFHFDGHAYAPYAQGRAAATCKRVTSLAVSSKLNYSSGMLFHILEKFPSLTVLELDSKTSIFNDKDLQSVIKNLTRLRTLSLAGCDKMTDAGLTGDERGLPLTTLAGLRTIKFIGSAPAITDASISSDLAFKHLEVVTLHLPWSESITGAGLSALMEHNPSLESLTMSGATISTAKELYRLARVGTHAAPRLKVRKCGAWRVYPDPVTSPVAVPVGVQQPPDLVSSSGSQEVPETTAAAAAVTAQSGSRNQEASG